MDPPTDVSDTFLTERQAEVLALRNGGLTQREVADRLGTSAANVSGVESAARRNVRSARRTIELAELLECAVRFEVEAGTDLRAVIDEVYARGDEADLRLEHAEPELSALLHERLGDRITDRQLDSAVEVGITAEGSVRVFAGRDGGDAER